MKKAPSVKKNYIYRLLYEILTMVTPFITAPYVSRILGADGIGIYSYSQSCIIYFTMFAALGTTSYGMREIARCRNDKYEYSKKFWEIELLTVFTTTVCLLAWVGVILCSSYYRIYFVALTPYLFATMYDISWFYTGHEKIGYTVIWNSICKILGVVCVFLFVNNKDDTFIYILINALAQMVGNISMWIFLPKMLVKVSPRDISFKEHFKETIVYFVPTIATTIYTVLDKTLIGLITHDEYENGYYEQATKIINMAKTIVFASVNTVMGARISYLFSENKVDEIKECIDQSMDFILLLGFGAMFGIIGVAKTFVPVFLGEGYDSVVYLLYWMSPLVVIIGVSNCLGSQYYNPAGLRALSAKYVIIGSCINLVLNLILIPKVEATGAVVGSIIAELTISILYLWRSEKFYSLYKLWTSCYKRIVAGLVMFVVIIVVKQFLGRNQIFSLVVQILCGITIYFSILIVIKDSKVKGFWEMFMRKARKQDGRY